MVIRLSTLVLVVTVVAGCSGSRSAGPGEIPLPKLPISLPEEDFDPPEEPEPRRDALHDAPKDLLEGKIKSPGGNER